MSAFIVSKRTIDAIATSLMESRIAHMLRESGIEIPSQRSFSQLLLELNVDAVNQRYPAEAVEYWKIKPSHEFVSDVQLFKLLECYLYQCSEGDIPERPLYRHLQSYRMDVATRIIKSLVPDYDQIAREL